MDRARKMASPQSMSMNYVLDAYHKKVSRGMVDDAMVMMKFERNPWHETTDLLVIRAMVSCRNMIYKNNL